MARVTKRQKRKALFQERLYAILRAYQQGQIKGDSTTIGQLDQPLTGVADLVVDLFVEMEG